MLNEYQSVDNLLDEIKGTTNFLSRLISRKFGLVFMLIVFGVIVSKLLF